MSAKIIVTGASGLLGREVMSRLAGTFQVEGWGFTRTAGLTRIDLLDQAAVEEAFRRFSPRAVVHCAAERRPDVMEQNPEQSTRLNVGATKQLAGLCADSGAVLVFISTDYVFDGTSPPYGEEARPNPLNLYGRSKVEGEEVVRTHAPQHCILRLPILYGPTDDLGESAVTVLAGQLLNGGDGELFFDDAAVRYPTHTRDAASALRLLIEREVRGTVHCSAEQAYTKYGMAVLMAGVLGVDTERIFPDPKPCGGVRRPPNAHLDNTRLRRLGFHRYTPFGEGVGRILGRTA